MKQRLQGILIGFLIAILLGSITVVAATQTIDVSYGITVVVNGIVQSFAEDMRPFTSGGRTFLPVRGVAGAFGLETQWEPATSTVYLSDSASDNDSGSSVTQPAGATRLDDLQHTDFQAHHQGSALSRITGPMQDYVGDFYNNGILFRLTTGRDILGEPDGATAFLTYPLGGQYSFFQGRAVVPRDAADYQSVKILFYGDDTLLGSINHLAATIPIDFNVDVTGVDVLTIKLIAISSPSIHYRVALVDTSLS